MEPTGLTFQLLEEVTNGFSEERKLGSGAYGKVYKGVHKNGEEIAVKVLYDQPGLDDEQFQNEFKNLMRLKHQNIVQLVGYCYETQRNHIEHKGKLVFAERTHRALCFEYMHNGSLQKHLSDEYDGLDWHTRYKIIKGTCEGLKYLHEGLKNPIYHLDLKPDNILLDKNMVPKLADFGLSRLFGEEQTRITQSTIGTIGYLPPEYIERNVVSKKLDVFSLGVVIIKIMTGPKGYSRSAEISSQQFVELVHDNWRKRLHEQSRLSSLEIYCQQVNRCIEIALNCVEIDRQKRPNIGDIIHELNDIETMIHKVSLCSNEPGTSIDKNIGCESGELLGDMQSVRISEGLELNDITEGMFERREGNLVDETKLKVVFTAPQPSSSISGSLELLGINPTELRFPFELDRDMSCPLQLSNGTDRYVAFEVLARGPWGYRVTPERDVVPPLSMFTVFVTMLKQEGTASSDHMQGDGDDVFVLRSVVANHGLGITEGMFDSDSHGLVREAVVTSARVPPGEPSSFDLPIPLGIKIIFSRDFSDIGRITSVDMHRTKPWILEAYVFPSSDVRIWNYREQKTVWSFSVTGRNVQSAKFIARKHWIVVGCRIGGLYIYSYDTKDQIMILHGGFGRGVGSLAVHATQPYVLSTYDDTDPSIRLWNWEKRVMQATFKGHSKGVVQVTFDPADPNAFASSSRDGRVKIWSLDSTRAKGTLNGHSDGVLCVDYLTGVDRQYLITGSDDKTCRVWDRKWKRCVHTIQGHGHSVTAVLCHSKLGIIITGTKDGTIRIWNATTHRLEHTFHYASEEIRAIAYLKDSRRVAVVYSGRIALVEIKLPRMNAASKPSMDNS